MIDPARLAGIRVRTFLLLALVASLVGFWFFFHWLVPAPFYVNYDPELAYMLSSLAVFRGHFYAGYFDHPGTPVQMIGSALLALSYPFITARGVSFETFHLEQPALFLISARTLVTLASITSCLLLARRAVTVGSWVDGVLAVVVPASFFAVHPLAFKSIVFWSHNSFNFAAGSLLSLALFLVVRSDKPVRRRQVLALGLGAGLLTAVQLYFAAWVIGIAGAIAILYILQGRGWERATCACLDVGFAAVAGFVVATLPIIGQYPLLLLWVYRLLAYQGIYGRGPAGIASAGQLWNNLGRLWSHMPLLFLATAAVFLLLIVAALRRRGGWRGNAGLWALAGGLSLQLSIAAAVVIKHPADIYMLSVAATLPLLLAVAIALLGTRTRALTILWLAASGLVLAAFYYNLLTAAVAHTATVQQLGQAQEAIERRLQDYAVAADKPRDSLVVLWTYATDSRCFTLWWGNEYASGVFARDLRQLCPRDLDLTVWHNVIKLADGEYPLNGPLIWDAIVAREHILADYPYLVEKGTPVLLGFADDRGYGGLALILAR